MPDFFPDFWPGFLARVWGQKIQFYCSTGTEKYSCTVLLDGERLEKNHVINNPVYNVIISFLVYILTNSEGETEREIDMEKIDIMYTYMIWYIDHKGSEAPVARSLAFGMFCSGPRPLCLRLKPPPWTSPRIVSGRTTHRKTTEKIKKTLTK